MNKKLDKNSLSYKICYAIVIILILSILVGSLGGIFYLFDKTFKPKTVNAEEISGSNTYTVNSAIISTGFVFGVMGYVNEGYVSTRTEGSLLSSLPLVLSTNGLVLTLRSYYLDSDDTYQLASYNLDLDIQADNTFVMSDSLNDYNVMYNFKFTSVDPSFGDLYSVLVEFIAGDNQSVNFTLTDTNGAYATAILQPYKVDTFGDWTLNYSTGFSARYLYLTNSYYNTDDQLASKYEEGYKKGYKDGQEYGEFIGENKGYIDGVNDSNEYTFTSLLDAVFYAPLKTFISIFNFEILGVNVLNIVTFVLTVLLFVGIIKWVI